MKFSKKYLSLVVLFIMIILGGLFFYHKQSSNPKLGYWEYMINQDPKPKYISEEKYFEGNQKGMCWRDNKIYTKDDLMQRAKLQFLIHVDKELDDYRHGRILDASEKNYLDTDLECQKNPLNCQLYQSNLILKHKELIEFLKKNLNGDKIINEAKYFSIQEYTKNINQTYIARYNNFQVFFSIDCCSIEEMNKFINFTQSNDGKQFVLLTDKLTEFTRQEIVKKLGLSNQLFIINSVKTYINIQNSYVFNNIYDLNIYEIFILNNCGDIFPISAIF